MELNLPGGSVAHLHPGDFLRLETGIGYYYRFRVDERSYELVRRPRRSIESLDSLVFVGSDAPTSPLIGSRGVLMVDDPRARAITDRTPHLFFIYGGGLTAYFSLLLRAYRGDELVYGCAP